jgi:hypothetical protein
MSLLEIIPEDTKAKAIEVQYNGALFTTFTPKELSLPMEKYRIVFQAVESLINDLDPETKTIVMDEPIFKSVMIAMSAMMSEDTLIKFIENDSLLNQFTVKEKFRKQKVSV